MRFQPKWCLPSVRQAPLSARTHLPSVRQAPLSARTHLPNVRQVPPFCSDPLAERSASTTFPLGPTCRMFGKHHLSARMHLPNVRQGPREGSRAMSGAAEDPREGSGAPSGAAEGPREGSGAPSGAAEDPREGSRGYAEDGEMNKMQEFTARPSARSKG